MNFKDDSYYTFVISRSTKNQIRIRRIEISRRWLHTGLAAAILSLSCASIGIFQSINHPNEPELARQSIQVESDDRVSGFLSGRGGAVAGEGGPDDIGEIEEMNEALSEKIRALEDKLKENKNNENSDTIPSIYPLIGKINNEFGWRSNPFGGRGIERHGGMDIDGEKGAPIIAPGEGVVIKAGWQGGYGNLIEITHGNGLTTRYGHLSQIEVEVGDNVVRGQQIGRVGSTGRSTGPHLHYEVRINNEAVNPREYLPPDPDSVN